MVPGPTGGIAQLCDLLDEHGDEIEADFTALYSGLDIGDVWRGLLSPRRALVLAEQLVYDDRSRYRAALLGSPRFIGWGPVAASNADIFDAVSAGNVIAIKAAGGKSQEAPTYPRPEAPKPEPEALTIDNFPLWSVIAQTTK